MAKVKFLWGDEVVRAAQYLPKQEKDLKKNVLSFFTTHCFLNSILMVPPSLCDLILAHVGVAVSPRSGDNWQRRYGDNYFCHIFFYPFLIQFQYLFVWTNLES